MNKETEQAGIESDSQLGGELFRYMADSALDGILILDWNGKIVYWNNALSIIFGFTSDEVLGTFLHEKVVSFEDAERIRKESLTDKRYEINITSRTIITEAFKKDKTAVKIEISVSSFACSKKRYAFAIIRDVSEHLNLDDRVRALQRLETIGRLTGGISHDYNNIVTIIKNNAEILMENIGSRIELKEILSASKRAQRITAQLLHLGRGYPTQRRRVNINKKIQSNLEFLQKAAGDRISVVFTPGDIKKTIFIDPVQIEQILLNFTLNSIDAMPNGGVIKIDTQETNLPEEMVFERFIVPAGEYIELNFTDSGCGINQDILPMIFEPFFTTKKEIGTGLGLSTVYSIVKQNDGYISTASEEGRGTMFSILFKSDICEEEEDYDDICAAESEQSPGSKRILIVDDEDGIRRVLSRKLKLLGYEVFDAPNPEDALKFFENTKKIDLLISDVVMPVMNGITMAQKIRAINSTLKVIFISGYTEKEILNLLESEKNYLFIKKPFSLSYIVEKITGMIGS